MSIIYKRNQSEVKIGAHNIVILYLYCICIWLFVKLLKTNMNDRNVCDSNLFGIISWSYYEWINEKKCIKTLMRYHAIGKITCYLEYLLD